MLKLTKFLTKNKGTRISANFMTLIKSLWLLMLIGSPTLTGINLLIEQINPKPLALNVLVHIIVKIARFMGSVLNVDGRCMGIHPISSLILGGGSMVLPLLLKGTQIQRMIVPSPPNSLTVNTNNF